MYVVVVKVALSSFRAELARWVARVRAGDEVVLTDCGTPVARLVPVASGPVLDELARRGVIGPAPAGERPGASEICRATASGPVAELVGEQRR